MPQPSTVLTGIARLSARTLHCVAYGDRLRDRAVIAALLARYPLFPLGTLARRAGHPLPDPARLLGSYRCRREGLVWEFPADEGAMFLGLHPDVEPALRRLIGSLESGTFIDVGANCGVFTVLAAAQLRDRGSVIAVEPHPLRQRYLCANVAANHLENVRCIAAAASDQPGVITLHAIDPSLGPHSMDASVLGDGPPIEVEARRLDDIVEELEPQAPIFLKIDVEGVEASVLRGASATLRNLRPQVIFEALDDAGLAGCTSILRSYGYSVDRLDSTNFLALPEPR